MTSRISLWHSVERPRAATCVTSSTLSKSSTSAKFLQFALVQDRDAVAHVLNVGQQVATHHHCLALIAKLKDPVFHLACANWVESARWFVEEDEVWLIDQSLSKTDSTCHAFRVLAELTFAGRIELYPA